MSTASAPLTAPVPVPTTLDLSDDSAITTLQRAAIGPVHSEYYLAIFERFEAADRAGPGWNWPASLCTLNWMLFRKLWWPALLYVAAVLAASLLVFGLAPLLLQFSDTEKRSLLVALATFAFLVPGVFGNAMLHGMVRRRIARALAASSTLAEACVLLKRQSSSRQRLMGLAAANVALAGLALAAWLALPGVEGRAASNATAATAPPLVAAAPASAPAALATTPVSAAASAPTPAASASTPVPGAASEPASGSSSAAVVQAAATPASQPETAASSPTPMSTPAAPALTPAEQNARAVGMAAYVPRRPLSPAATAAAPEPPASSTAASKPAQATAAAPPAAPKPARKAAAAASAPATGASGMSSAPTPDAARPYFINVGLFAEEANARRAFARLMEAGLPALVQELAAAKGTRWRLRAGPFPNRDEADAAAGKIRALQLEAMVVRP